MYTGLATRSSNKRDLIEVGGIYCWSSGMKNITVYRSWGLETGIGTFRDSVSLEN